MDNEYRLLLHGLDKLTIADTDSIISGLLTQYIREIRLFNTVFNLVKTESPDDILIRHIFDSLAPWDFFYRHTQSNNSVTIADIGSGAGFPGIPLACVFSVYNPAVQFTLVERMQKRVTFLQNVCAALRLSNVHILHTNTEKLAAQSFDIVTCRAYRPLSPAIIHSLQNIRSNSGIISLYKGPKKNIHTEIQALTAAGLSYTVVPVDVPFLDAERNLIVF